MVPNVFKRSEALPGSPLRISNLPQREVLISYANEKQGWFYPPGIDNCYGAYGNPVGYCLCHVYQSRNVFSLSVNKLQMCQDARIAMDGISRDLKGAMLKDKTGFLPVIY